MKRTRVLLVLWILTLFVTGCTSPVSSESNQISGNLSGTTASYTQSAGDPVTLSGSVTTIALGGSIQINGAGAAAEGHIVKITAPGNYSVNGTLADGQILINCDGAVVNLELAECNITNSSGPAIYGEDAKMINIILKDGTANNLSDGSSYGNAELKAPLFIEDNMTIQGSGTLNITGNYKHGIASDDAMTIKGGTINITSAVTDGLHANDGIIIDGGILNITAASDGIESELAVTVNAGSLTIAAGDDGIHAETDLIVNNGIINVTESYEGLEGKSSITVGGGTIRLICDDDSVNSGTNCIINGGYIYAECGGDGLDSNGNMTINGGTIIVFSGNNANGPIDIGDRGNTFVINGGTVLATGGNMGITVSETSKQYSLWIGAQIAANTLIDISSQDGTDLIAFKLIQSSSLIFYSSDKLASGGTYTIKTGGTHSGALTDGVYGSGSYSGGSALGTVAMTSKSSRYGNAGGGMGGWNDFGPGEGGRRPSR